MAVSFSRSYQSVNKYDRITQARKLLELPERATMEEIKANYRSLIRKWHPDRCKESEAKATKTAARIVAAYGIIMDYCNHYQFSFSRDEVSYQATEHDWWFERFGEDPVWR
jgi:DnaJ-class molecular chaperone